jgi:uncharacterized membrane protein
MTTALVLVGVIGAGTIGGVFFAFSTFVMRALAQLPPAHGVAAMQRINVVVLNPLFLGTFMGTAVVQGLAAVLAVAGWSPVRSPLLLAAAALYIVGTFGVTMALNVPRNDRLQSLPADGDAARTYWPVYVRKWTFWNHVRTVAALASAVCGGLALMAW